MRTTIRLDDDLLDRLKREAQRQNVSLTRIINRTIKAGLAGGASRRRRSPYKEQAHAMGVPRLPLDKALSVASALEDEEIGRELTLGK